MNRFGRGGRSKQGSGLTAAELSSLSSARDGDLHGAGAHLSLALSAEHGGPAVCGDCSSDTHTYSEEQAFCPQPVPRDSAQPGTLSGLEPSPSDHPRSSQQQSSGAADGSRSRCRGSLYPSNHDRMLAALKKPAAPLDGKGNVAPSSEAAAGGEERGLGRARGGLTWPLPSLPSRGLLLDDSTVV